MSGAALLRRHGTAALPCAALFALLALAVWVYAPGQGGEFVLDDRTSLLPLATARDAGESLVDAVRAERSGPLGRPLATLTFALEQFYLDAGAATVKRHNTLLHALNGALLFWFALLAFRARAYPQAPWLALAAAALWVLAPLQVSTVLYAVQRMAMLATTCVLLALIAYLQWRGGAPARLGWAALCLGALAAAPFAKENGVLALPLVLLLEAVWLRGCVPAGSRGARGTTVATGLLAALALAACAYLAVAFDDLTAGYRHRAFTLAQRLWTEPLILWDYLRQFYWPEVERLGLLHDDVRLVTAPGADGAALAALAGWLGLLGLALLALVRAGWTVPLFCLLFFLGAHSLEASVLALELYFEHRNYLPSVALALLPAAALGGLGRRLPALVPPLLVLLALLPLALLPRTSAQVLTWSEGALLDLHHVAGHPRSPRAHTQLATRLAGLGEFAAAREHSARAFRASRALAAARPERAGDFHLRNIALACLARAPLPAADLTALGRVNPGRPLGSTWTVEVIARLEARGRCPTFPWNRLAARLHAVYLRDPAMDQASVGVYTALAVFAGGLGRTEDAFAYAGLGLRAAPQNVTLQLMQLHHATVLGRRPRALALRRQLQAAARGGRLTAQERRTLARYEDYR